MAVVLIAMVRTARGARQAALVLTHARSCPLTCSRTHLVRPGGALHSSLRRGPQAAACEGLQGHRQGSAARVVHLGAHHYRRVPRVARHGAGSPGSPGRYSRSPLVSIRRAVVSSQTGSTRAIGSRAVGSSHEPLVVVLPEASLYYGVPSYRRRRRRRAPTRRAARRLVASSRASSSTRPKGTVRGASARSASCSASVCPTRTGDPSARGGARGGSRARRCFPARRVSPSSPRCAAARTSAATRLTGAPW